MCVTELVEYDGGVEEDLDSLGLEDLDEADLEAAAVESEAQAEAEEGSEEGFEDPIF